jgi:hypothetical protein
VLGLQGIRPLLYLLCCDFLIDGFLFAFIFAYVVQDSCFQRSVRAEMFSNGSQALLVTTGGSTDFNSNILRCHEYLQNAGNFFIFYTFYEI